MVNIKPSGTAFDVSLFDVFQGEIGAEFDPNYVVFLQTYNGGNPETNVVNLDGSEIQCESVQYIFGIGMEAAYDLRNVFRTFQGRIPSGFLPIAVSDGGNLFCLSLRKENRWQVFLWDHDSELLLEDDGPHHVATSFQRFLECMAPPSEQDSSGYNVESIWIDPDFLKQFGGDDPE